MLKGSDADSVKGQDLPNSPSVWVVLWQATLTQRLHIDYHYGIGPQESILIMVLGSLIP